MRLSKTVLAVAALVVLGGAGLYAYETARPRVHPIKQADALKIAAATARLSRTEHDPVDTRTDLFGPARAIDGDTLLIGDVQADLWTIAAPLLEQTCERDGASWACGEASRANLERLVADRTVACRPEGPPPRDGRWLGVCFVSKLPCVETADKCESDLSSLNLAQVRQGWAEDAEGQYSEPESDAREEKLGIWAGRQ